MTSLTPHRDAAEATITLAQNASRESFLRKDEVGSACRVSFATSVAFNRAVADEQDAGTSKADVHGAVVVTLANLIGAICAGNDDPYGTFNSLVASVSLNVVHRLQTERGRFYVEPQTGAEPGHA